MTVRRFERSAVKLDAKVTRTPHGFLICDAVIAKSGNVQTYYLPGGKVRREYRPPEEVFHPDSIASAQKIPITFTPDTPTGHPPEIPVTKDNARKYTVGFAGDVVQDGDSLKSQVMIFDAEAISKAMSGEVAELSCGYYSDLDFTPGMTTDGVKYDVIQRNIRHNHIAQVRMARAGHDARFHLDSQDNQVPEESPMKTITIDGVQFEVSDQVAQAHEKFYSVWSTKFAGMEKDLTTARSDLDKQKARADAAEAVRDTEKARADAAEKARTDAVDPKRVEALVKSRVELVTKTGAVLGSNFKMDGKTDLELKQEVLKKLAPKMVLDGKSVDYIDAAFDYSIRDFAEKNPAALALIGILEPPDPTRPAPTLDAGGDARKQFMKDQELKAKKMGQPEQKN